MSLQITGTGIISAIGNGTGQTLMNLLDKKHGISSIRYLQTIHKEIPCGEVKYSNGQLRSMLGIGNNTEFSRSAMLGAIAVRQAMEQAHLEEARKQGARIAFISGTTVGGMEICEQLYTAFTDPQDNRKDQIPQFLCGNCADVIADYFGDMFCMATTPSTACSSASGAIILGAELIKSGYVDIAVAGGCECLSKFHLNGFNSLMILDKDLCRPFDATRAGLNLGEGAGYLVIESEEWTEAHKSTPLCTLAGYGNACDAFHQTASSPDGRGAYAAMEQALDMAHLKPGDIDYINAHGTGTPNNDLSEGMAVMRLFGDKVPYISSTKSFTGHTTSASGGVESVICILAMQNSFIPASLRFTNRIDELTFLPTAETITRVRLDNVLCNAFGFGGNDTSLLFSR